MSNILIAVSCVIGLLLIILTGISIVFLALGAMVTVTGVIIGVISKNKANAIQMQNRHELDDLKIQINEVFPDLV